MLKETIIAKFTQVLAAIPQAQQDALAVELAKMTPATPDADVDWGIGRGYNTEKDELDVGISLKIVPAKSSMQEIPLLNLISNAVYLGKEEQLFLLEETLSMALVHIVSNRQFHCSPALYLTESIASVRFRFWGNPSEEAKIFGEEKRKVMQSQKETTCL
jgi:hypothetical protein